MKADPTEMYLLFSVIQYSNQMKPVFKLDINNDFRPSSIYNIHKWNSYKHHI